METTKDAPASAPPNGGPLSKSSTFTTTGSGTESATVLQVPDTYLARKLGNAELLLGYAAEVGIAVDEGVRNNVLKARIACAAGMMTQDTASNLLSALASLATAVRPVTVESLETHKHAKLNQKSPLRSYAICTFVVGVLVLLISLITFVSSRVSESIKADVDTANALAAKLALELGPPPPTNQTLQSTKVSAPGTTGPQASDLIWFGPAGPPAGVSSKDVITDLQKFAATLREIDGNARQLNHFVLDTAYVPFGDQRTNWSALKQKFELTAGLNLPLSREFTDKLQVYQEVRNFATTVVGFSAVYYGALATCILPVLYALLGAAAYLLRLYDDQMRNRTFVAADKHVARFLIAGIGGLVVGQFNVTPVVAISPFAAAFLVGYAADLFFAFLDNLLQNFKARAGAPAAAGK